MPHTTLTPTADASQGHVGSSEGLAISPALPRPYYADHAVTLYHGDTMELLPLLPRADAVVTDPPYGETSLDWDKWPDGWPALAALVAGTGAVIHCAGVVRGARQSDFDRVNVEGVKNLLHAVTAAADSTRLFYLSSLAAREPELSYYAQSK